MNLEAERRGEEEVEVGVVTAGALVVPKGPETWWRGEAGRRLPLRRVERGVGRTEVVWMGAGLGVNSSSASSEMSHTLGAPEWAYESSWRKGLRVRLGEPGMYMGGG